MKNLEIALCDLDSNYVLKFANHLMMKANIGVHIFTTPEGFFQDETDFDVAIITEDFEEISGFRPKGVVGHKYILTEDSDNMTEDFIYKFQAVDKILDEIKELKEVCEKHSISKRNSNGKSKLIGVYSPANHELQLPFSMALGQAHRTDGKVLFVDLEEISIMPNLIGRNCERNLMDLLYLLNTNAEDMEKSLSDYVRSFMGFDYIEPFWNPNEISEIDEDTWDKFFEMLVKTDYDVVVILFGRAINGFARYIERMNRLFVLGRPGDYFRKWQENFLDYLDRIQANISVENVILPMSAGNLTDGSYQLEELLHGNLGVFVKKLINSNERNVIENYG
ncbi:hypothetical protein [Pseudobutyrivibrio xylanivorans]|uniref:AAA domain-containing protein n=1 Tax=Pseudobutyrivibrio xylanivorans DSM 14809 TaxID=1123012 RepID=A0A1M6H797_PSEXY|nr:hypothetical protein [Pseudobutyrivibrio xylanivorans]SHJ18009.1 hypothetical protein SAMN02745725_01929 [Pseudobutyrivibrio xylanivorans DSM 14809]